MHCHFNDSSDEEEEQEENFQVIFTILNFLYSQRLKSN